MSGALRPCIEACCVPDFPPTRSAANCANWRKRSWKSFPKYRVKKRL